MHLSNRHELSESSQEWLDNLMSAYDAAKSLDNGSEEVLLEHALGSAEFQEIVNENQQLGAEKEEEKEGLNNHLEQKAYTDEDKSKANEDKSKAEEIQEALYGPTYPKYFQATLDEYADQYPQLASWVAKNISYDEKTDAFEWRGIGYLLGQDSEFKSSWTTAPAKLPTRYQLPVGVNPEEEGGVWKDLYAGRSTFGTMIDALPIEDTQQAGIIFGKLMGMTGKLYWTNKQYNSSAAVLCFFHSGFWGRYYDIFDDDVNHVRGFRSL